MRPTKPRSWFTRLTKWTAHAAGRPATFVLCMSVVLLWAFTGPFFKYSDSWQLVINTSTTIVTFLMVFLIQSTQNRDGEAMQVKLDEIIRAARQREKRVARSRGTGRERPGGDQKNVCGAGEAGTRG